MKIQPLLLATSLLLGAGVWQSCEKEILTGQPEWLGNSIYERLEEGIEVNGKKQTFNTTLRIINDLPNNQAEVLSHTGSRTLFVTSDEDFEKWFATNDWGVRSYEDLTLAQKKILFYNSMINNAYLLELMSNVSGNPPQQGYCMRRATAASIQDTVFEMLPGEMPADNPLGKPRLDAWRKYRDNGKTIKIFKDNTAAPMIHFLPSFMRKNNITGEDLSYLSNGKSNSIDDAWINGKKVISEVQTCKNGYIYVVDGVIESSRNMADIINHDPRMSRWASLMNRFAAPFYDKSGSDDYNRLHGGTNDSIFVLRYYSDWSAGNKKLKTTPDGLVVPATLTFDPGWNQYMYNNTMSYDMHYDAGAMIVPTNEALDTWWESAGKGLQKEYGSWENIPALTLSKLLCVNMLPSFVDAVPSKFNSIVDDSKVTLGIKPENIVECFMGCNGVVYLVNQVFSPSEYRSVVYPSLASQSLMGVIYNAISNYDFGPYLNSMESKFSMILPYNTSESLNPSNAENGAIYLRYIDPCTYGLEQQIVYEFFYDDETQTVDADRYLFTLDEEGNMVVQTENKLSKPTSAIIKNRLSDMVDNLIIIGTITPQQKYYKTKAGSIIYVDMKSSNEVYFAGGYQLQRGEQIKATEVYDMEPAGGNGQSYGMTEAVPQTASQSVYEVLKNHPEFSMFYSLIADDAVQDKDQLKDLGAGFFANAQGTSKCANSDQNMNIRLFDNYNYTVYVPTNEAIQKLIDDMILPTWEDYENATTKKDQEFIAQRIRSFIRYHIQDNAVYVAGDQQNGTRFETAELNPEIKRFYSLGITANNEGITIEDLINETPRKVITSDNLYNLVCREYWMSVSGTNPRTQTRELKSSSNAVVHQIDGVLLFSESQTKKWTEEIIK